LTVMKVALLSTQPKADLQDTRKNPVEFVKKDTTNPATRSLPRP